MTWMPGMAACVVLLRLLFARKKDHLFAEMYLTCFSRQVSPSKSCKDSLYDAWCSLSVVLRERYCTTASALPWLLHSPCVSLDYVIMLACCNCKIPFESEATNQDINPLNRLGMMLLMTSSLVLVMHSTPCLENNIIDIIARARRSTTTTSLSLIPFLVVKNLDLLIPSVMALHSHACYHSRLDSNEVSMSFSLYWGLSWCLSCFSDSDRWCWSQCEKKDAREEIKSVVSVFLAVVSVIESCYSTFSCCSLDTLTREDWG